MLNSLESFSMGELLLFPNVQYHGDIDSRRHRRKDEVGYFAEYLVKRIGVVADNAAGDTENPP